MAIRSIREKKANNTLQQYRGLWQVDEFVLEGLLDGSSPFYWGAF